MTDDTWIEAGLMSIMTSLQHAARSMATIAAYAEEKCIP